MTAGRGGLLDEKPGAEQRFQKVVNGLVPAAVFLASIPIAYLAQPYIAQLFWLSLVVVNPAVNVLAMRIGGSRVGSRNGART